MCSFFSTISVGATLLTLAAALPAALDPRASLDPSMFPVLQRAANLSSAAYSGCQGQAFDVIITKQIDKKTTSTQGYIGYSTSEQKISVVIQGSTSNWDFVNDVDVIPVKPNLTGVNFPSGVLVMKGIVDPWSSVHDEVITEVSRLIDLYPNYTLESTGHSLGGAMTYMSYIALAQNFPTKSVYSNALAAFPIGNQAFADFGTAQNGTLNRGDDCLDGVPNMYTSDPENFVHYGTEYYSYGTPWTCLKCDGETDPQCSAGNGLVGVTIGHYASFGIVMETVGCGGGTYNTTKH